MSENKLYTKTGSLKRISLSIYSFGYSAGFIQDNRAGASEHQKLTPMDIAVMSKKLGLGGIEIPIDKYFPMPQNGELSKFIQDVKKLGLKLVFDLEQFSFDYLQQAVQVISEYTSFIRVKISNFYGGNRFGNKELYANDLTSFHKFLTASRGLLGENNLRILIENHQDIVLEDIEVLVKEFGQNLIGINWDVGNSLPSGETVESFLDRAKNLIGNVHLKDYRLFTNEKGYLMSRCALGKGFVDFEYCLNQLDENIPLTIELGALNSRTAEIYHPEYWENSKGISTKQIENFNSFIKNAALIGDHRSAWELKSTPEIISSLEHSELTESIEYLKQII
ncbi:MAG: sugar phosphate isomerase/epimerase [Psychroserpens sp.]|jgi:sugar phosphate isomerase/epimerase